MNGIFRKARRRRSRSGTTELVEEIAGQKRTTIDKIGFIKIDELMGWLSNLLGNRRGAAVVLWSL